MVRRLVAATLAALLVVGSGCLKDDDDDDNPTAPETPAYLAPTTPGNVLHNLQLAYVNRDIDAYTEALGEPFVFVPSDADASMDILDRDADLASTENMFENVQSIQLRLTHPDPVLSDRQSYPAEEGYSMILVSRVELAVVTRDLIGGEPLILQVGGDPATFIFRPDSTQTPPTYRIVYQKDDA